MSDAADMLRAAVRVGPWPVIALRDILREAGLSDWDIKQGAAMATAAGDLRLVRQNFWASSLFLREKGDRPLYVEGHARDQLISRLSLRARPPQASIISTEQIMQGEDAERLAREEFAKGHERP